MTKLILLLFSMTLFSCGQKGAGETAAPITEVKKASTTTAPSFNADSAYAYVEKQVSFGYRIPNTPALQSHRRFRPLQPAYHIGKIV